MNDQIPTRYNPVQPYEILDGLTPQQDRLAPAPFIDALLEQTAPFVPPDLLEMKNKKSVNEEIQTIIRFLRSEFLAVLREFGVSGEGVDQNGHGRIPSVEKLCVLAGPEKEEALRRALGKVRDSLVPDILARLGLMPSNIWDRSSAIEEEDKAGAKRVDTEEQRFTLLHEVFPENDPAKFTGSIAEIFRDVDLARLTREDISHFSDLKELAEWMEASGSLFQRCVRDAFLYLGYLRSKSASRKKSRQSFELQSDLNTKSLVELMEIVFNDGLMLERRFEAMILMEWAIGFFNVRTHPVYKAQIGVQKDMHERLNLKAWDEFIETTEIPVRVDREGFVIPASFNESLSFASFFTSSKPQHEHNTGRKVVKELGAILQEFDDVLFADQGVCFNSRVKAFQSIVTKLLIKFEFYKKCLAKIDGEEVPDIFSEDVAEAKLVDMEEDIKLAHPEVDLPPRGPEMLKFFDINMIRDNVGLTFALVLRKPIDEFTEAEKPRVNECFEKFARQLAKDLKLEDVTFENQLWTAAGVNSKRAAGFRDFKIFGYAVGEDGVRVPVEVQIQPFETYSLSRSPRSDLSAEAYHGERRAGNLEHRILPGKIGNYETYFPKGDLEGLGGALKRVGE
jgi:hypothetical protein